MNDVIDLSPSDQFQNLINVTPSTFVSAAIQLLLVVSAVVFFFFLVIGGIKWITSGGDKSQTEAARQQITAAFVGLVIVFAVWAILTIVGDLFDVNLFNLSLNF